jgi:GNAT superfamily N-acetyltransferase
MSRIRPARPDDAAAISALALRSKSSWGYPPDQMAVFRAELTLDGGQLVERRAQVWDEGGLVTGFYTLLGVGSSEPELDHLFVDPLHFARGIGRSLFRHACRVAASAGGKSMVIRSDPHAAGFYRAVGAVLLAEVPSRIPGRSIPCFTITLAASSLAPC